MKACPSFVLLILCWTKSKPGYLEFLSHPSFYVHYCRITFRSWFLPVHFFLSLSCHIYLKVSTKFFYTNKCTIHWHISPPPLFFDLACFTSIFSFPNTYFEKICIFFRFWIYKFHSPPNIVLWKLYQLYISDLKV